MITRLLLVQLLIACLIVTGSVAQPVFTSTDFAPHIGDQYTVGRGSVIVPTNTGPNQTWNFSSANISSNATYTVNQVSAIPCGSQYPLCNMGTGNGAYDMVQITATEYNSVGNTITPGMAQYVNSDPEKLFEFPMTYSYSFSDTWSSVNNQGPYPTYQEGADTVTYDGYGTLITPYGTYTNAMRINRQLGYTDSTQSNINTCSGHYTYWFVPGYRYPVVVTWIVNCTQGFSAGLEILQSITAGIDDHFTDASRAAYPNPFTNSITFEAGTENIGSAIEMRDVSGRLVMTVIAESDEVLLNCEFLQPGAYFITVGNRSYRIVKL